MTTTTTAAGPVTTTESAPRAVASAPGRRRFARWTIDRVLALVAAILLPSGLVAIVVGWFGAAHTPFLFEQIPYLISGGLLGLALVGLGGLLYFGSWLTRVADQQREDNARLREIVAALRADIHELPYVAATGNGSAPGAAVTFVATATGTMYHLSECSVVAGKEGLREVDPEASSMRPCKLCAPAV